MGTAPLCLRLFCCTRCRVCQLLLLLSLGCPPVVSVLCLGIQPLSSDARVETTGIIVEILTRL
eukprot:2101628-Pyramimonas_sp.AAC.2